MIKKTTAPSVRSLTASGSLLLAASLFAQSSGSLDESTILANRTETPIREIGSAVTILDIAELTESGIVRLDEALSFAPGIVSASTGGQHGSISSLLIRGTSTSYAQIRVDGMRTSGPNISTGNFFGGANLNNLSRIEILRGPQSALYGGDAVGGVIGIYSAKGSGDPSGFLDLEAGSFSSFRSSIGFQGEIDKLSYNFTLGYEETDNDLPNNSFSQSSYALRLDYQATDDLRLGMTLRGFESRFRRPDYTSPTFARGGDDDTRSLLATLSADLQVNALWQTKLTLGYYDEDFYSQTFASPRFFDSRGTKYAAYWENTLEWNDQHTTVAGADFEKTDYEYASLFFALSSDQRSSDLYGIYVNHTWNVTDDLTLNGGLRWEDIDTYGTETTWRFAAAYQIQSTNTKLRASIGEGFRPPAFTELYSFGGGANFDLRAEQSLGWDVGIDQEFCDGQHKLSLTYFENRIEDLIESSFGPPPTFAVVTSNVPGTTETRGIEFSSTSKWLNDRLETTLSYTWLDQSIANQPEHSAGLLVNAKLTEKLDAGFSIRYLDQRRLGGNQLDAYTLVNLHTHYQLRENITISARVENLFDEDYLHASFGVGANRSIYPGRGTGVFGGIKVTW